MSKFEIITPNNAETNQDEIPGPSITQEVDGVESPVELSKTDMMIKTKTDHYCEEWWAAKKKQLWDRWKNILLGAVSTGLMMLSAYLGRVSA